MPVNYCGLPVRDGPHPWPVLQTVAVHLQIVRSVAYHLRLAKILTG